MPDTTPTFSELRLKLSQNPYPVFNPDAPVSKEVTTQIAALELHPTLEANLHLLNHDLPSAHFLVRHMQSSPAVEGMLLHSILHRIEGDFNNARAWAGDVWNSAEDDSRKGAPGDRDERGKAKDNGEGFNAGSGPGRKLMMFVYGDAHCEGDDAREPQYEKGVKRGAPMDEAGQLIDYVEKLRKEDEGDRKIVEREGKKEMERMLDWCAGRFGTERWVDASSAYVQPSEEIRTIGMEQTSGGKGFRDF